jgi:DNA-binding XRE family transcriptional regulator
LRLKSDLTQAALAAELRIARSTLANIEAGRERPSDRLWEALCGAHSDWTDHLREAFESSRQTVPVTTTADLTHDGEPFLGGPFILERVAYVYLFEESRSPNEIIEIRRVRALRDGASTFGLSLRNTESDDFRLDQQVLWGGSLTTTDGATADGGTAHWRRVDFGRALRTGQSHEFALRTWIEVDPEPQTEVCFGVTVPAREVSIHLGFHGSPQPSDAWRYGPLSDESAIPKSPSGGRRVKITGSSVSATFRNPVLGPIYGIAWRWDRPSAQSTRALERRS